MCTGMRRDFLLARRQRLADVDETLSLILHALQLLCVLSGGR